MLLPGGPMQLQPGSQTTSPLNLPGWNVFIGNLCTPSHLLDRSGTPELAALPCLPGPLPRRTDFLDTLHADSYNCVPGIDHWYLRLRQLRYLWRAYLHVIETGAAGMV